MNEMFLQLSEGETIELLKQVKTNDKKAFLKLLSHNFRLVYEILKYMDLLNDKKKFFFQAGIMGLVRGINTCELNQDLKKYFVKCIMDGISDYKKCKKEDFLLLLSDNKEIEEILNILGIGDIETLIESFGNEELNAEEELNESYKQ